MRVKGEGMAYLIGRSPSLDPTGRRLGRTF